MKRYNCGITGDFDTIDDKPATSLLSKRIVSEVFDNIGSFAGSTVLIMQNNVLKDIFYSSTADSCNFIVFLSNKNMECIYD